MAPYYLATGAKLACTSALPGTITVARLSVRQLPGAPAQAAHHSVHGLDEMGLVHRLSKHSPGAPQMRQRVEQHVRRRLPRELYAARPVPLDLLSSGVVDLDGLAALHP